MLTVLLAPVGCFSSSDESVFDEDEATQEENMIIAQFVQIKPIDNLTKNASPTIQWTRVDPNEYFAGYVIQIARDAAFTQLVGTGTTSVERYKVPLLKEDGVYYFRVAVKTIGSKTGVWSFPISFVLDKTSPVISITKPSLIKNSIVKGSVISSVLFNLIDADNGVLGDLSELLDNESSENDNNNGEETVPVKVYDPVYPTEIEKAPRYILLGETITVGWEVSDDHLDDNAIITFEYSYDADNWEEITKKVASYSKFKGEFSWTPGIVESPYILFRATYSDYLGNKAVYTTDILYQYLDTSGGTTIQTVLSATPDLYPAVGTTEVQFEVQQGDPFCPDPLEGEAKCFYPAVEYRLNDDEEYKRILADDGKITFKYLPSGDYDFSARMVSLGEVIDSTVESYSFSIDTIPPIWADSFSLNIRSSITGLIGYTSNTDVLAQIGSTYGVDFDYICLTIDPSVDKDDSCWQDKPTTTIIPYTFSSITNNEEKILYLFLKDLSQNISEPASAKVIIDTTPADEIYGQVYDYDSVPERSTYSNNYSLKLKVQGASCNTDVYKVFIRATLKETTVIEPTSAEIASGNLLANSMITKCRTSGVILDDILDGLVPAGGVGPYDVRIHLWAMDKAGNLSDRTYTDIQYYTGGYYFSIILNNGQNPIAAEGFNITINRVDSDRKFIPNFNEDVDMAFSWKNSVLSVIGDEPSIVLAGGASSTYTFEDGTWSSSGGAYIVYNIVRGEVDAEQKTVLQVDAVMEDLTELIFYSDSFLLDAATLDHVKIVNRSDDAAVEVGSFTLYLGESKHLYLASYDVYGNWIERVEATWNASDYLSMYDFTFIRGMETTFIPSTAGTNGTIRAVYNYIDTDENPASLDDTITNISVLEN